MLDYERITCDDVIVGDQIARAKTHEFRTVTKIDECYSTRRIYFVAGRRGDNIRPRRETKLWRLA